MRSILSVSLLILLSACSTTPSLKDRPVSPLIVSSCPNLTPLVDNSFGAIILKLQEVAAQYHECRTAALGGNDDSQPAHR